MFKARIWNEENVVLFQIVENTIKEWEDSISIVDKIIGF